MAVAAGCAAALGYWLLHHPIPWLAGLIVGTYGLLVALRPGWWVVLLPGLWPVADLTPWTGWMHATESDALVLMTIGVLSMRSPPPGTQAPAFAPVRLRVGAVAVICLVAISYLVSLLSGLEGWNLAPGQLLEVGYHTPWNVLRVAKGFFLAVPLMLLLSQTLRRGGDAAVRRFFGGMTLGLFTASLAALWERAAFTGMSDFSSDYRTTALFWEMHVGGAALDGWLALTLPFLVVSFVMARRVGYSVALLGAGALAAYAVFTTFSRGVYAAAAVIALVLFPFLLAKQGEVDSTATASRGSSVWLLGLGTLVSSILAFSHGGYRGMAACLGFAILVHLGAPSCAGLRWGQQVAAWVFALLLAGISLLMGLWFPKGVYAAYGLSWVVALTLVLWVWRQDYNVGAPIPMLAALIWTAINATLVGGHWGGDSAWPTAIAANALIGAILVTQAVVRRPLWQASYRDGITFLGIAGIAATVAVSTASYYVGARFSTVALDLAGRVKHWSDSVALVRTPIHTAFGIGSGRFPDAYFWQTPGAAYPGTWEVLDQEGVRFMRLGAPRHTLGFGEMFRVSQRVGRNVEGPFSYRLEARASAETAVNIELCRKHLLYTDQCAGTTIRLKPGGWQTLEGQFDSGNLRPSAWYLPRPTVLSLALVGGTPADIRGVSVLDGKAERLLRNEHVSSGADYWFFSSDRHHLPWHAKNLWVHLYVEQGMFGVVAVGAAVLAAFFRLATKRRFIQPLGAAVLAGLAGIMVVGVFDSLLDVPRFAIFFYLIVWLALSLSQPQISSRAVS